MTLSVVSIGDGWASTGNAASQASTAVTVAVGDLIVACSGCSGGLTSITDSQGGSWTLLVADSFGASSIHYRTVTTAGSLTVTVNQPGSYGIAVGLWRVVGADLTIPFGATGSGSSAAQTINPTALTSTVASSILLVNANDYNHKGIPSSSDLTSATYSNNVFLGSSGIAGTKALGAPGAQTFNAVAGAASPSWYWAAVEVLPGPLPADTSSSTTFTSIVTANTTQPAAVTSATTFVSTVNANTTQPAAVTSTTTFASTLEIPVPRVTSATTFAATVTAFATPPLPAATTTTTTFASTVTAVGVFSAQVSGSTSFRSRVTATRTGAQPVVAPYGPLRIGRITLTEPIDVDQKSGDTRVVTLSGLDADQTFYHPTQAQIRARMEALLAYAGQTVPVTFSAFPHLDGWYQVGSPGAGEFGWYDVSAVEWTVDLLRVGSDAESQIESRLVLPSGGRAHASAAVAELWHSPPPGSDCYTLGASSPGWITRIGEDGVSYVYRALAAGNPRYGVPVAQALAGAATATVAGEVRTGLTCPDVPTGWSLSNGLIRIEPRTSVGTLRIASYLTSGWGTPRVFDLKRGTSSLGMPAHVTILRNDRCEVVLRLTWDNLPGQTTCDLSLRRGSRFVGLHLQQSSVASALAVTDAGPGGIYGVTSLAAGWTTELNDDVDGNRWVIGSTLACSWPSMFGLQANVAAASLPAMIGVVRGGTSAVSGDTAADVYAQYLGSPSETERVIRR